MDYFEIEGKNKLFGDIAISGAKNAVLPLMAAAILNDRALTITNVPKLSDSITMGNLIKGMGGEVNFDDSSIVIDPKKLNTPYAPYKLVKTMRASFYVLGPLVARFGEAKVSLPGGCAWGPRPVDFHLEGLKKLGIHISLEAGYVIAKSKKIVGNKIVFPKISVGATGNVLMAAVLAEGDTEIHNAAAEPEIQQLCLLLNQMGAKISGIGTNILKIQGVENLGGVDSIKVIPDRIEAGTFLIAVAATGGKVRLNNVEPKHMESVISLLKQSNIDIEIEKDSILVTSTGSDIKASSMETNEYPGFPTDLQAQWMLLMSLSVGDSTIKENIYFDRFTHILELNRLGCDVHLDKDHAVIKGDRFLIGADVMSTDIRASAALIIAALCAEGSTSISRVYHIDRGYDRIEEKLVKVGAKITRKK
ncbi:UDP-N-acetylglucosamine 1-carboxyvinyltransferase [Candidatus Marinimicrobia bacterium]|jgi:UDP-N-acetylglucosamine 1-carboxyvinyltransferase|nr:UDP-N-acetylglucosamine 1-carboxyvinyltransferase [Candidatus Neomarinimicrobiota bacterium]MDC0917872.1 UDP-N-acetylglucosamine 1-carboxyvinyltransferase [Candidatus Neomarinimicrobiota bacterium]